MRRCSRQCQGARGFRVSESGGEDYRIEYGFDNAGRPATVANGGETYAYEPNSNLLKSMTAGYCNTTRTLGLDPGDSFHGTGVIDPVRDPAGNMTTMPKPGAWTTAFTCKWDAWSRLVEVKQGSTQISLNDYDALHRRTRKTTPAETRDCYFDRQWRSIEERVSSVVKSQHTWSPLDRWTLIRRKRSVSGTLDETLFCLKDYLDPAAVVNSTGAVQERYRYDAFGPVRFLTPAFGARGSSSFNWNFLFHAEFLDPESGLYNYGYRFYHPSLGRWISRDPIGEDGGWNLYGFVGNDGVNSVDLFGLACPKIFALPKELVDAMESAWKASFNRDGSVTEQGASLDLANNGLVGLIINPAKPGESGSIGYDNFPKPARGTRRSGTFHTHPYPNGLKNISFSCADLESLARGEDGKYSIVMAGDCIFVAMAGDRAKLSKCIHCCDDGDWKAVSREHVESKVKAKALECGFCYYRSCRNADGKFEDATLQK